MKMSLNLTHEDNNDLLVLSSPITQVKDGDTLVVFSMRDAVTRGMIDGESAWFTSPGTKTVYSLREALEDSIIDAYGKWVNPQTGKKGYRVR